jgi:hypothetical protein
MRIRLLPLLLITALLHAEAGADQSVKSALEEK